MSTKKIPPDCDQEIFREGKPVVAIDGKSQAVERWVQAVAQAANARVDWHYSGGTAQVLHLGDNESRERVHKAIKEFSPTLEGTILRYFQPNDRGLHRQGVTEAPPGAIAGFTDPDTGQTAYLVAPEQ